MEGRGCDSDTTYMMGEVEGGGEGGDGETRGGLSPGDQAEQSRPLAPTMEGRGCDSGTTYMMGEPYTSAKPKNMLAIALNLT